MGAIKARTRSAWSMENLTIYECQTNALGSELEKGVEKAKRFNAELVFVVPSKEIADEARGVVENRYRVLVG